MGKQINYYMEYSDFQRIAQLAIDNGCKILKSKNGKIICDGIIDIVTPDINRYFFYVPEAGPLNINIRDGKEYVGGYHESGNVVIEASFSSVNHEKKKISRARIFSITGYDDEHGNFIGRPECVKKVYDKLERAIKKIAPYTEVVDVIANLNNNAPNKIQEWRHKEYITASLLKLKLENGYRIGL